MQANIKLMDNVLVRPVLDSSSVAHEFKGKVGTVFGRQGNDLLVVFPNNARLCLARSEVVVTSNLADRLMAHAH
jgi:ribosomal protein L21E